MPPDPDRREAEERDDRAREPREVDEPGDAAPERDRDQGYLFPWEEKESEPGSETGLGESGAARGATDRSGDPAETAEPSERAEAADTGEALGTGGTGETGGTGDAEAPEGAEGAGPRRGHGLMSREKVLWEWPYPGDWVEEALD